MQLVRVAALLLAFVASGSGALALGSLIQIYLETKCQPTVINEPKPPNCAGDDCGFFTFCLPNCESIEYSGGECDGPDERNCTIRDRTVDDMICRVCECSGFFVGVCRDPLATTPSGTRTVRLCSSS